MEKMLDQTGVKLSPELKAEIRYYINSGSFFRSQMLNIDTYAERNMYPPTEMGYAKIIVRDYQVVDVEKVTV